MLARFNESFILGMGCMPNIAYTPLHSTHESVMGAQMLARFIESVARDVRKLCLAEPRCVHVRAPCYILGTPPTVNICETQQ